MVLMIQDFADGISTMGSLSPYSGQKRYKISPILDWLLMNSNVLLSKSMAFTSVKFTSIVDVLHHGGRFLSFSTRKLIKSLVSVNY